jgi:hypothetical protein
LESIWRVFLFGNFKRLSRYFPVKDNESHKISSFNLSGVFEKVKSRYLYILFWITTTTAFFLVYTEKFVTQSYKKWVN